MFRAALRIAHESMELLEVLRGVSDSKCSLYFFELVFLGLRFTETQYGSCDYWIWYALGSLLRRSFFPPAASW